MMDRITISRVKGPTMYILNQYSGHLIWTLANHAVSHTLATVYEIPARVLSVCNDVHVSVLVQCIHLYKKGISLFCEVIRCDSANLKQVM